MYIRYGGIHERIMANTVAYESNKIEGHPYCWIWTGCVGGRYPQHPRICVREGKRMRKLLTHRLVWELHNKQKLSGPKEIVRHMCHNALCVNPYHLITGTQKDNVKDSILNGTHITRKNKNVSV